MSSIWTQTLQQYSLNLPTFLCLLVHIWHPACQDKFSPNPQEIWSELILAGTTCYALLISFKSPTHVTILPHLRSSFISRSLSRKKKKSRPDKNNINNNKFNILCSLIFWILLEKTCCSVLHIQVLPVTHWWCIKGEESFPQSHSMVSVYKAYGSVEWSSKLTVQYSHHCTVVKPLVVKTPCAFRLCADFIRE